MNLKDKITVLKGIGGKKAETFASYGVATLEDLLYFFPRKYEDRRFETAIENLEAGKDADLAIFDGHPLCNMTRCKATMIDGEFWHNDL